MPCFIAAGWSRDELSGISTAIRYLTRPGWRPWPFAQWSHMFLYFAFPDGSTVVHEALLSGGWTSKPGDRLDAWRKRDLIHHVAQVHWLPIDTPVIETIYRKSCGWLGTRSYAVKQIAAFAVAESMLGRWLGLSIRSGPEELICSEGACMLIGMAGPDWDLRQCPEQSWDSVSPQSAYNAAMRKLYPLEPW